MDRRTLLIHGRSLAGFTLVLAAAGCATVVSPAEQIAKLMREGQAALQAKQYDEAIGKYRQVIGIDAKQWVAYLGLARGYIGKAGWAQAVQNARLAHQLSPGGQDVVAVFAEALYGGGIDALKGGRFSEAIGFLVDYVKIQPNLADGYLNLGRAFLGNRDFKGALDAFVRGLAVAGGTQREELLRGFLDGGKQALSANDLRGAIGFLREYVKADRGNLNAWLDLARASWNAGDRSDALNAFREVLRLSPSNAEALRFMLQR